MENPEPPLMEKHVQHIVFAVEKMDGHAYDEKRFTELGFRQILASDDKRLVFHLPYGAFVCMRDGDSATEIRDQVLKELSSKNIEAFVIVASDFACGQS
jgi:hypothetical protein